MTFLHSPGKGFSIPARSAPLSWQSSSALPPPLLQMEKQNFISCSSCGQCLRSSPASFPRREQQQEGGVEGERGKGAIITPNLFISAAPIFISKLNSQQLSLSLAHNQMIAQGFAERRHEAAEPASPLPVWGVGGCGGHHIIQRKRCTCFQQWRG